jgi:hypothetical protein
MTPQEWRVLASASEASNKKSISLGSAIVKTLTLTMKNAVSQFPVFKGES